LGDRKAIDVFLGAGGKPHPDLLGAVPASPENARVTKIPQGGLEMSVENFAKNGRRKSLGAPELPLDFRSACATEVQAKVAFGDGARKPSWSTGSWNTHTIPRSKDFPSSCSFCAGKLS
jgi:hypothetical protein